LEAPRLLGVASPDVIARESGRSSTPRPLDLTALSLEYWITRISRVMTGEAGDDSGTERKSRRDRIAPAFEF